jgi:hypothetical protein
MNRELTNVDLVRYAKKLGIKNFEGVFAKDRLPRTKLKDTCAVVNLQDFLAGSGTHWVCFYRNNFCSYYFDSFGLQPPHEVRNFLAPSRIITNQTIVQKAQEVLCGQYCLFVLLELSRGSNFFDIIFKITKGKR